MSNRLPVYAIMSGNQHDGYTYRHITSERVPQGKIATYVGFFTLLIDNELNSREWSYVQASVTASPQPSYDVVNSLRPRA
jgi:hypothetical protein